MTKVYAVRGSNDEVTTCSCCGRTGLKKTAILEVLDSEGNGTGIIERFGVDCAARASGWTQKEIKSQVKAADEEARKAAQFAYDQAANIERSRWEEFLRTSTGKVEISDAIRALGGYTAARQLYKAR